MRNPKPLPTRAINALRRAKVTNPELLTLGELLSVSDLGVEGVTAIASRINTGFYRGGAIWPELER